MTNDTCSKMTPKVFFNKLLAGTAQGTIIALIPNAVIGAILKYFADIAVINMIINVALIFQIATPLIIAASGVIKFDNEVGAFIAAGTGDIINIMLTAAVAVLMMMWIGAKFGSVEIIALPIVVGIGAGLIGMMMYPYVTQITVSIGNLINDFTNFQPIIMSILISCSFALLIISPLTTVGIGMAIQLNGISAGAATMGIAATTIVLVINSWRANKSGVTLAIALGGMKMMMPNLFKYPIILLPCLFTATIAAIPTAIFNISGTFNSAGFGLVGLVGPLAAFDQGLGAVLLVLCWFIIPIAAGLLAHILFVKIFKLYDNRVVFKYQG